MARVRAIYDRLELNAELAPFFSDLPARLASSHLVISRSGAGTVAELAAIGRPSILVPLPGSIDQDQFANAGVLDQADGALRIPQAEFTPGAAGAEISALAAEPARLTRWPRSRSTSRLDAAERLADLVAKVAESAPTRNYPCHGRERGAYQYSQLICVAGCPSNCWTTPRMTNGDHHETAARDRTHPLCRDRRHRHERHCRGADQPRLTVQGSDAPTNAISRDCATRASRSLSATPPKTSRGRVVVVVDRDQA